MSVPARSTHVRGQVPSPLSRAGRAAIHAGGCPLLPPSATSERLVDAVRAVVADAFDGEPESAHHRFDSPGFFAALTRARAALAVHGPIASATLGVLAELGASPRDFAIDRLRLRAVAPGGHHDTATRDAYALHRDTWYANPRAQINLWVPLRTVSARDGLSLYPSALRRPLRNDSARFDYEAFRAQGGFQSGVASSPATYPRLLEGGPRPRWVPCVPRGGRLLFSAAQLHGPTPHQEPETRFSVDVRVVARLDQRLGRGAPSVDDRSRGDAGEDYTAGRPPGRGPS